MRPTAAALILGCLASVIAPSPVSAQEGVWRWFAKCPGPNMMALEVRVDGRRVYQTSFTMCREDANGEFTRQGNPILIFRFRAGREIMWTGYKESEDRTNASQEIEGNIWEAGGQAYGVLLGASFESKDSRLMNTIIFAEVQKRSETMIAPGLSVTTYPLAGTK